MIFLGCRESENPRFSLHAKQSEPSLLNCCSINLVSFSLIKCYVDTQDTRKALDFDLLRISPGLLIYQIDFYHSSRKLFHTIL